MTSVAQLGQDLEVVAYFKGKKNGYYVDVGANDGVYFSNTHLLEKTYGWKGICVEPLPDTYARLVKNRPKAQCVCVAAYDQSGLTKKFCVANLLSGIVDHIDCHMEAKNQPIIEVQTRTLTEILDEYKAPSFIEYLSVDTEGSELEVLKSIDFSRYRFGMIHLEHNFVEPRRTLMRQYLLSNGYKYFKENKWDDVYVS
jgi:FkbM family methyltransferase